MATKLTPAQTKALQYYSACKVGMSLDERRRLRIKYPTKRVQTALVEKGLLHWVTVERFDYLFQAKGEMNVVQITPEGEACLSK